MPRSAGCWPVRPERGNIAIEANDRHQTSMSAVLETPQRHAVSAQEYLRMGEGGVAALALPAIAVSLPDLFPA